MSMPRWRNPALSSASWALICMCIIWGQVMQCLGFCISQQLSCDANTTGLLNIKILHIACVVFNVPVWCSPSQESVLKAPSEWATWLHPSSQGSLYLHETQNPAKLVRWPLRGICYQASGTLESFCWKLGASNQFWELKTVVGLCFRMAVCLGNVHREEKVLNSGGRREVGRKQGREGGNAW